MSTHHRFSEFGPRFNANRGEDVTSFFFFFLHHFGMPHLRVMYICNKWNVLRMTACAIVKLRRVKENPLAGIILLLLKRTSRAARFYLPIRRRIGINITYAITILNKLRRDLRYKPGIFWSRNQGLRFYPTIAPNFSAKQKLKICRTASLVQWSACLTNNHEVAGSIPGTSTILNGTGSTQPGEDNWVAT